jgi:hypothetical protein
MSKQHTRRKQHTSGIKYLIASLSLVASVAMWSLFSNQDRIAQLANDAALNKPAQTNTLLVEPMPTLATIQFPDGQVVTVQEAQQDLRSVTAPPVIRQQSNPTVVTITSGGGSTQTSAPRITTTTGSSG